MKQTLIYTGINFVLSAGGLMLIAHGLGFKEIPPWFALAIPSLYYLGNFLGYLEGKNKGKQNV